MPFDPERLKKTKATFDPEKLRSIKDPGILSKINTGALNVAQAGLEAIAAPTEVVGEMVRGIAETPQAPLSDFRAPSIVQRFAPSTRTAEPPSYVVDTANKLLRGAAGGINAALRGNDVLEGARATYNAPRGAMGMVEDAALGLLSGKLAPQVSSAPTDSAIKLFSETARGLGKATKLLGKSIIRVGLGPTFQDQSLMFRRPGEVKGALDLADELPNKIASSVNELAVKVDRLDNDAWDSLLKLKAEPRSKILKALQQVKIEFKGTGKTNIGDADKKAVAQIDRYIDRIKEIRQPGIDPSLDQMLDQPQLKNIVQSIRRDARFDLPETDPVNRAVQMAQAKVDKILKGNGNYAEIMDELAPATKNLKETASKFALKRVDGAYVPSDTTVTKLVHATDKKKIATQKVIDEFSRQSGENISDTIKLSKAKNTFGIGLSESELRDNARGSARTLLGSIIGGAVGGGVGGVTGGGGGAAIGSILGREADIYGGTAAGKIIELLSRGNTSVSGILNAVKTKSARTPFQQIIESALSGNPTLAPLLKRYAPAITALNRRDR